MDLGLPNQTLERTGLSFRVGLGVRVFIISFPVAQLHVSPNCMPRFMKTQIDIKSALFGLGIGIAAMLAIGASSSTPTVGRYQIGGTASHGLVVDTATGQVWSKYLPQQSGGSDNDFAMPKLREQK